MLQAVLERFVWESVEEDCRTFCAQCLHCVVGKDNVRVPRPWGNVLRGARPNEVLNVDFVSTSRDSALPECCHIEDSFSSKHQFTACASCTALEAARAVQRWIICYGTPEWITSDRGAAFLSELFQELAILLGFRHNLIAAHTHTGNAKVERGNRLFLGILRSIMSELRLQPSEWGEALAMIEHGINNTSSAALGGLAPNEVFLGCKRDDPLDGIFVPFRGSILRVRHETFPAKLREMITEFMEVRQASQAQLCEIVATEYSRRRLVNDRYNRKHFRPEAPVMDIGSYVLVASHLTHVPKLKSAWSGPMVIAKIINPLVFQVRSLIDGSTQDVHASRLRSYRNDFLHSDEGIVEQAAFFNAGYEVEAIVGVRQVGKSFEVLVHWFGFESSDDTWEPALEIWNAASGLMIAFIKCSSEPNAVLRRLCDFLMVDFDALSKKKGGEAM